MEKIRKAVEEFKQENGNNNFTQKDLLMYVVKRIDDLPCENHMAKIAEACSDVKNIYWILGGVIALYGILVGIVIAT